METTSTQSEKRNLVSSVFITILLGIAYQEMIEPAKASLQLSGLSFGLIAYFAVFILTTLRFFIGSQVHISDHLLELGGKFWFFDLAFIALEMTVMIFMGSVASPDASEIARIPFSHYLITLYSIDVAWIVLQWVLAKVWKSWARPFFPWAWGLLNSVLIISIVSIAPIFGGVHTLGGLIALLVVNVVAFVIDVLLVNHYGVL
jgi:hypothetical protein